MSFELTSNREKPYNIGEHLIYSCQYHVIFCPKYRKKLLYSPYDTRLKEIFNETAEKRNFHILEMEIMPDHVHLLIDCDPRYGIIKCVKNLKGASARMLATEFPEIKRKTPNIWTRNSFISSVGAVSLEVVKKYIEDQKGV